MTNQYMTKLYHDLLSNSPQTVTIDIPADMGTGQISQVVTKQGAVVSDWKMNYFSDMNVQGVSCEDYIQLLFCFNDGVSWNIADARQCVSIQKGESCICLLYTSCAMERYKELAALRCFTHDDMVQLAGSESSAVWQIKSYLQKGYIERVRRNLYAVSYTHLDVYKRQE